MNRVGDLEELGPSAMLLFQRTDNSTSGKKIVKKWAQEANLTEWGKGNWGLRHEVV